MAIKFSQFTVRTSPSDLSHIVGYNGADNIQITPTNFLNSALTGTAGQVLFYDTTGVAGDNDLYWDNTNKRLGIGTSTPGNILEVKTTLGAANVVGIFNGTMRLQLGLNNSEGAFMFVQQAYALRLGTGNTERMRVTAGGDVGIGTTSPGEKLEVNGNGEFASEVLLGRMDQTAINSLTAVNGMIVYNTTTNKFQGYEGGAWSNLI